LSYKYVNKLGEYGFDSDDEGVHEEGDEYDEEDEEEASQEPPSKRQRVKANLSVDEDLVRSLSDLCFAAVIKSVPNEASLYEIFASAREVQWQEYEASVIGFTGLPANTKGPQGQYCKRTEAPHGVTA
jgi:hypothetical protein